MTPLSSHMSVFLPDAEATDRLGDALAPLLRPGDTLLLDGPIGAGKSHLARRIIQQVMPLWGAPPEEVPSPTFTLVQTYDTPEAEIWHADLYRLGDAGEVAELGLTEAFDMGLCLVEWPDRLGSETPAQALTIALAPQGTGRTAALSGPTTRWSPVITTLKATFVDETAA